MYLKYLCPSWMNPWCESLSFLSHPTIPKLDGQYRHHFPNILQVSKFCNACLSHQREQSVRIQFFIFIVFSNKWKEITADYLDVPHLAQLCVEKCCRHASFTHLTVRGTKVLWTWWQLWKNLWPALNQPLGRSAKFGHIYLKNMQYTPGIPLFRQSRGSKICNFPLESGPFWPLKYGNFPPTYKGASRGLILLSGDILSMR
jgi:hypothetical protein